MAKPARGHILEYGIKSEANEMGNLKPEDDLVDFTSTWVAPVIIKEGVFKYRTPWWFCISLAWVIQKDDGFIQFLLQGHKVLSFKWNLSVLPLSGVFYVLPGVRLKWKILQFDKTIQLFIEDHRCFTIDIDKIGGK